MSEADPHPQPPLSANDVNAADGLEQPGRRSSRPVAEFVHDHPWLTVAGGLAFGLAVAALLPKGSGRRLARRAARMAEAATAASVMLGEQARESAESAGSAIRSRSNAAAERLDEFSDEAADRIEELGGRAAKRLHGLIDPAERAASQAGHRIAEGAGNLASRLRH